MSRTEKSKLDFTVALIAEFASAYKLKQKQAFNYLNRFKGIQFLHKHYEVLHTLQRLWTRFLFVSRVRTGTSFG